MQFTTLGKAGLSSLLFIAISFAFPHFSVSQIDTTKTYTLDEVIISASRWQESAQSAGRNVTVITSRELRNSTYYSVGELLAAQQSLHLVGNSQTPGATQSAFLRNANSNHSVVMIDGVRISDPSTPGNAPDLLELSLARVERIEIVRGSHSTLYGASAIGGVINIITRGSEMPGFSGTIGTRNGTFGNGTYSTANQLDINYTTQRGFYADFGLFQEFTHGLDATIDTVQNTGSFNPQDQDDFNKLDLAGEFGYKTDRLSAYASYRRVDQTADADQGAFQDARNAQVDFRRDLISYGGSFQATGQLKLTYSGAYSDLNRLFVNDSSTVNASGTVYDGSYTETNAEGTLWENELTARWETTGLSAIAGIGNSQQTMNTRNYTYLSSYNYESETDLDSLNLEESINYAFIHTELNGSLLNDRLESFSLGLGSRLVNHHEFGTHLTFEVNPKLQLSPSALVYGAVTSGFNAPSLYQLYSPAQSPGYVTNRGNKNLEAETSISYELGWKQTVGTVLQLNLSLFRTDVNNVIEYVYLWNGDKPIAELNSQDYGGDTYLNASRQQVNGVELGLQSRIARSVTVSGNLSYTHSTLKLNPQDINQQYTRGNHVQIYESGEFLNAAKELGSLTRRPSLSGAVNINWQATDNLQLRTGTRFVGNRDDVFYSSDLGPGFYGALDRSNVDGYSITDVSVRYQFFEGLSVIGKVENLLDTDYVEINGYRTRGRGFFVKAQFTL